MKHAFVQQLLGLLLMLNYSIKYSNVCPQHICSVIFSCVWLLLVVLTDIEAVVVAALSRGAVDVVRIAKPLQGDFGCIFHLLLKSLGFLGAPVELLTVRE